MSNKADVGLWGEAVGHLEEGNFDQALDNLVQMKEQSCRIRLNIGMVYEKLGQMDQALQVYTDAQVQDPHCALAYFLRACGYFKQNKFAKALKDFEDCEARLRGRKFIDYNQLGMKYKLYTCDIIHNQGVCYMRLNNYINGMEKLLASKNCKTEARHKLVDQNLETVNNNRQNCPSLPLLLLPQNLFFKPPKSKIVAGSSKHDYLGSSKVVTALDENDRFTGFSGALLHPNPAAEPSRSAPHSPGVVKRGKKPVLGVAEELVGHLNRALSPDQDTTPAVLRSDISQSRTPPARWSPTSENRRSVIPPPPMREMPRLQQDVPKRGSKPSVGVPTVVVSDQSDVPSRRGERPPAPLPGVSMATGNSTPSSRGGNPPPIPPKGSSPKNVSPNRSPKLGKPQGFKIPDPPNKKPPPLVPEKAEPTVKLTLICVGEKVVSIRKGATLTEIIQKAAEAFNLENETYDIWRKNTRKEFEIVENDATIQTVWSNLVSDSLTLWVFGKQ